MSCFLKIFKGNDRNKISYNFISAKFSPIFNIYQQSFFYNFITVIYRYRNFEEKINMIIFLKN